MTTEQVAGRQAKPSGVWTAGLALFSMFFGAGNLVFPLLIGSAASQHVWLAICGLAITAVLLPLLGLATMVLLQGQLQRFFDTIGRFPGAMFLLILQLILGPFGVIPRLLTLMQATVSLYLFELGTFPLSLIWPLLIFAASLKRERVIGFLGAYLTPPLILCLVLMIGSGLIRPPSGVLATLPLSGSSSFKEGLLGGYNMMDLIAALPFAALILPYFQGHGQSKPATGKMLQASLIAGGLLLSTYAGLALIAAKHSGALCPNGSPEQLVGTMARRLLGTQGGAIATLVVLIACMTTAITLTMNFSSYMRQTLCKSKISSNASVAITIGIAALFATLGFEGIAAVLGPLLGILYPALIALTVTNLLHVRWGVSPTYYPTYVTLALSTAQRLLGLT